jgi:hypothetical protein
MMYILEHYGLQLLYIKVHLLKFWECLKCGLSKYKEVQHSYKKIMSLSNITSSDYVFVVQ